MHLTCLSLPAPDCLRRAIIPTHDDLPALPPGQAARWCTDTPVTCGDDAATQVGCWTGRTPLPHPALRARHHGAWQGRALRDLPAQDMAAWITDPHFAPPGGESLRDVLARAAAWLSCCPTDRGEMALVADALVIRALVLATLGADAASFAALDIAPYTRTVLTFHNRWRVRETGGIAAF
ncbi:histidine phosphatase family protein [Komagataeibacter sp. FNDCR1]|nr:histidine phosphatase family protein [Komagataeibacter sp. FNDCR1]